MPLFNSLDDLEAYCQQPNWNGNDEEAIALEAIDCAHHLLDILKGEDHDIEATEGGNIELTFYVTNKAELKVFINEKTHTLGFFHNGIEFEKTLKNSRIHETGRAIEGFLQFYSLVYV